MTGEPYVPLATVAEYFSVSEKTLRRWLADRTIPAIRVGRQIRLRLSDVEGTMTKMGSASPSRASDQGMSLMELFRTGKKEPPSLLTSVL